MTDSILSQEEFSKKVLEELLSNESGLSRFNKLLQHANLEKELLQISLYKSAEFVLQQDTIKQINQVQIDRLTLVYPPSFAFSADYQINGHFNVTYNSAITALPKKVKPFIVNYTGILIPHEENFEIKNERITLKEQ